MANFRSNSPMTRPPSFEELFEEYSNSIYYFFVRRGFSHEESLDLAQETFYRACRGLRTIRQGSNLSAWLFTIAANVWRNEVRHRKADKRAALEVSLDGMMEGGQEFHGHGQENPLEEALETERSRRLRSAVGALPDQMRRCLMLRVKHDMKYEEIATVMQVSVNTVKSQLFQARRKLQAELH